VAVLGAGEDTSSYSNVYSIDWAGGLEQRAAGLVGDGAGALRKTASFRHANRVDPGR
jgi:hypothetical protein